MTLLPSFPEGPIPPDPPREGSTPPIPPARHFLRDDDLSPAEQAAVLDLAERMKKDRLVWEQAENRLHAQKALLTWLCTSGGDDPPEPPRAFGRVERS